MHISKNVSIKSCHIFKKNKNGHFIFGFFWIRSIQNGSNSQSRWTDISNSRIQARRAWLLVTNINILWCSKIVQKWSAIYFMFWILAVVVFTLVEYQWSFSILIFCISPFRYKIDKWLSTLHLVILQLFKSYLTIQFQVTR